MLNRMIIGLSSWTQEETSHTNSVSESLRLGSCVLGEIVIKGLQPHVEQ